MLLWHVGLTTAFVRYAFRDEHMDLRFLALGAILPDVIDTPIGVAVWQTWQTPRLWSHSLAFGALLMTVVLLVTRRGRRRKQWMLVAVGVLMHLALDGMWSYPETLWWPFLGWTFFSTEFATFSSYAYSVLQDPLVWAGEAVGLVYLVVLWRRSDLSDATAREVLLTTGRVSAPIERR